VGYSLSDYDQFCARVHRPGQDRPVVYFHLIAENTVDQAIYKAIERKRDIIECVLEQLKGTNA
jgi:SNF2 family DNA or RNA helicase